MFAAFIITFRETLEAALIVGIILGYLKRTKQTKYNRIVFFGIAAGILGSILGAFLFNQMADGFEGRAEEIFEGITMLIGAGLLTWMIFWMMRRRNIAEKLQEKIQWKIDTFKRFDLFALVFVAILREGIETVIFLHAIFYAAEGNVIAGALLGPAFAVALGYAIFAGAKKIKLKKFFAITGVLLILFAAGLFAHGLHELQEAGVVPTVVEHVWDINPALHEDGSYPLLHEKGHIGSLLSGLFGYNGNPSLIEIMSYTVYLVLAGIMWKRLKK
jgi:high-affinity iron transporter